MKCKNIDLNAQGNEGLKTVGNNAVKDYRKSSCGAIGGNPV